MVALQALPALVAGDAQGDPVLGAELLELGHDAASNNGGALGEQAVHHALEQRQLALDRVAQEVGVDQHAVRRHQRLVVLEEQLRRQLGHLAPLDVARRAGLGFRLLRVRRLAFADVLFQARVAPRDYALYLQGGEVSLWDAARVVALIDKRAWMGRNVLRRICASSLRHPWWMIACLRFVCV